MPKSSTLTTAYSYDSVGNLLTQASSGASDIAFSYSYNKNGYITGEVRTENGQTTESSYAYDALGQLTSFLQSTGYGEQYAYDKAGNMTGKVISGMDGESIALSMSYNKGNQLTAMANGKNKITYSYDKNGSMVQKVLSSQTYGKLTDTYAYNALDQLTSYTGYDGYTQQFTYDANGMRLSKSEAGDANRSTLEELLRGNIAGLPGIVELAQSQTNANGADAPTGLEWATTEYLYDLTQEYYQVISETTTSASGTSATTAYAYGLERIAAYNENGVTRYVYDGRGSVVQTISAPVAGAAVSSALPDISVKVQSFAYTAFGEQMGGVKVSGFTYNAEAYDAATGMLNLRARLYEPALGRFSQKDIYPPNLLITYSFNAYEQIYDLKNQQCAYRINNLCGVMNSNREIVTEPVWNDISTFAPNDLLCVYKDGLLGWIDRNGNYVLELQWKTIYHVKDNRWLGQLKNGEKWILDDQGNMLNMIGDNLVYAIPHEDGYIEYATNDGYWGFFDSEGNILSKVVEDEIKQISLADYSEGWIQVELNEQSLALMYVDGTILYSENWTYISPFYNGYAIIGIDGYEGFVDTSGNLIHPAIWKECSAYSFMNGQLIARVTSYSNEEESYINESGQTICGTKMR